MKDWKKEDDETEKTAGGKIPETKDEYIDAVEKRKGFWMDWRQMKAVAATSWNGLGVTVIVYEWTAGEWKLRGRLMAKSGEKQVIVPMRIVGAGDNRHCVIAVPGPGMDDKYPEA